MKGHKWTDAEINYLLQNLTFQANGYVTNHKEVAKDLDITNSKVTRKIQHLRAKGVLPRPSLSDVYCRDEKYSYHARKRIVAMHRQGATYKEIADSLGRTKGAIAGQIREMRKTGQITTTNVLIWNSEREGKLLSLLKFDNEGSVDNYDELAQELNIPKKKIRDKVERLRKKRIISRPSVRVGNESRSAYKKTIDLGFKLSFAQQKGKENRRNAINR